MTNGYHLTKERTREISALSILPLRAAFEYHNARQEGRGIESSRFLEVHTNTVLKQTDEEDGHIIKYGRDSQLLCLTTPCPLLNCPWFLGWGVSRAQARCLQRVL